jgi:hypothetical protein
MQSEDGEVYIITANGNEEWATPTPVGTAIVDAVVDRTDLAQSDIEDIEAYVDLDTLAAVVTGEDDTIEFEIEGHDVFVDADGDIEVAE